MEIVRLLGKTPSQIGELRRREPESIAFIEQHIIYEQKEQEKSRKEMERKSKAKKGRRR